MRWTTPLQTRRTRALLQWLTFGLFVLLSACGGGDDGGSTNPASSPVSNAASTDSVPSSAIVAPRITPQLSQALDTGDVSTLTHADAKLAAQLAQQKQREIVQKQAEFTSALYQGVSTEYDPTEWSVWVQPLNPATSQPLIVGDKGYHLASLSTAGGGRSVGYGVNLFWQFDNNLLVAHRPAFKRMLGWLVLNDPNAVLPAKLKVAILGVDRPQVVRGMQKAGVTAEFVVCDYLVTPAPACLKDVKLLIISAEVAAGSNLEKPLRDLIAAGYPVLYAHANAAGWTVAGEKIMNAMGLRFGEDVTGNYSLRDKVSPNRDQAENLKLSNQFRITAPIFDIIASDKFSMPYDWSACKEIENGLRVSCNIPSLDSDFFRPLRHLKSQIDTYNRAGQNIFETPGTDMLRYLILWADTVRSEIKYPIDKAASQGAEFQRAFIADTLVAYVRRSGKAQPDLKSFAGPSFSSVAVNATDEEVEVTIPEQNGFTAIGRMMVPGKPMTLTVKDAGTAKLSLKINTQRSESTMIFTPKKYDRPKYLASPEISLQANTPIQLVSPYGGTMQLVFSNATPKQKVRLSLRGVAQHPFLDQSEFASGVKPYAEDLKAYNEAVKAYTNALKNTPFDWTEYKLPGIEVHARTSKLLRFINRPPYNGNFDMYFTEMKEVLFEGIYQLAGFDLPGKTPTAHVLAMCTTLGWNCVDEKIHKIPSVNQHIQVDEYAACGGACAGNPFDTSGDGPDPRGGQGLPEAHEMGHNLQRPMLQVYGSKSGEVSNNYFPIHLDWRLHTSPDKSKPSPGMGSKTTFNTLVKAKEATDPIAEIYDKFWKTDGDANGSQRMDFYLLWVPYWAERNRTGDTRLGVAVANSATSIANGWDIVTLLYMHQRQFDAVTPANWPTEKAKLGYGTYAAKPSFKSDGESTDGNDNLLIVLSLITQRDQRKTFDLWGVKYSTAAATQVASFAFAVEPALFYSGRISNNHNDVKKVDMSVSEPVWPF